MYSRKHQKDWFSARTIRRLAWAGSMALVLCLAACGGKRTVVTEDDSADYQGARSLPPLKKPQTSREEPAVAAYEPSSSVTPTATSAAAVDAPVPVAPVNAQPTPVPGSTISAQVVEQRNGQVQLQVDAGRSEAWRFVRKQLSRSDITVHTRNQAAGLFQIGCAGIDDTGDAEATKKGRWSIFNRKQEEGEYCALELSGNDSSALLTVLDRAGQPVAAEVSRGVFSRLLNI